MDDSVGRLTDEECSLGEVKGGRNLGVVVPVPCKYPTGHLQGTYACLYMGKFMLWERLAGKISLEPWAGGSRDAFGCWQQLVRRFCWLYYISMLVADHLAPVQLGSLM